MIENTMPDLHWYYIVLLDDKSSFNQTKTCIKTTAGTKLTSTMATKFIRRHPETWPNIPKSMSVVALKLADDKRQVMVYPDALEKDYPVFEITGRDDGERQSSSPGAATAETASDGEAKYGVSYGELCDMAAHMNYDLNKYGPDCRVWITSFQIDASVNAITCNIPPVPATLKKILSSKTRIPIDRAVPTEGPGAGTPISLKTLYVCESGQQAARTYQILLDRAFQDTQFYKEKVDAQCAQQMAEAAERQGRCHAKVEQLASVLNDIQLEINRN